MKVKKDEFTPERIAEKMEDKMDAFLDKAAERFDAMMDQAEQNAVKLEERTSIFTRAEQAYNESGLAEKVQEMRKQMDKVDEKVEPLLEAGASVARELTGARESEADITDAMLNNK